jgi:molybdopterin-guanine dinucleotide biosynthesis protein B
MRTFGIVGLSGNGKTTLVVKLVPELVRMGLKVSTMKHAHHGFDLDTPGKDSYRHREAGATEVMMSSSRRWVLQHEMRDEPEATLDELLARMSPVDLVVIEGFKAYPHAKIEVYRPSLGKKPLFPGDPHIVAVASDEPLSGLPVPVLDLDDTAAIAGFIVGHCRLEAA